MTFSTYEQFQEAPASDKKGLVKLEAARRVMGWTLHSGSIYKVTNFTHAVLISVEDSSVALTEAASVAGVTAGKYYHDRDNQTLYVRTSDSVNPNTKFIGVRFWNFFSNDGLTAPHDISTGFEVYWLPLLDSISEFGVEVDNQNQLGVAIEGSGSVKFQNDRDYWNPIYDKWYFENQRCFVYSWHPDLAITEAKLIYRGRVQTKSYTDDKIAFSLKDILNELRAPVEMPLISEIVGVRVPDSLLAAFQRTVYGYVYGHVLLSLDQPLDGYPLTGTFSAVNGDKTITGSGTAFLSELSPGDEILIGVDEDAVTVESITSNTSLEISEEYEADDQSGVTALIQPSFPKRYMNRDFLVSGHALREPTTTVTKRISLTTFEVASVSEMFAGDPIIVDSFASTIDRISGNVIKLTTSMAAHPDIGATVRRPGLSNVRINNRLLRLTRDYTYDAATGRLTLDPLAEFNVAPVKTSDGVATFTNGSRSVTGTGTSFKTDLRPGDWIKATGQADYFEVSSIQADGELLLKTNCTYDETDVVMQYKNPVIYEVEKTVLSCDVLGKTANGLSSGTFLKTGPQIVRQLLVDAGFTSMLDEDSFTDSAQIAEHKLGIVIPNKYDDKKAPKIRDIIDQVNQSIFGCLSQNADFELSYSVLSPKKPRDLIKRFDESDGLNFTVQSDSSRLARTATIRYLKKEYDYVAEEDSFLISQATSRSAAYLAKSQNEKIVETCLVDQSSAEIMASRWALILEISSSIIRIQTKLKAARLQINDKVELSHEKLYERIGSTSGRKIAAIQKAVKTINSSTIEIEDLANAFSRCAAIADDDTASFSDASDDDKLYSGFITDDYGMMDNDPDTFGINLIW